MQKKKFRSRKSSSKPNPKAHLLSRTLESTPDTNLQPDGPSAKKVKLMTPSSHFRLPESDALEPYVPFDFLDLDRESNTGDNKRDSESESDLTDIQDDEPEGMTIALGLLVLT
jgi:hypothetical protein